MKKYNIPIFVPHRGCAFDCVFCNQRRITGSPDSVNASDVRKIIDGHLETIPRNGARVEAAFFGGSFTGIPLEEQNELLGAAYEYVKSGAIDGIRLSTRPDYIDERILDNLLRYGVTTIELGVQSTDDGVLKASNRGHTRADTVKAASLIRKYPFALGMQMMTGLPEDTDELSLRTADDIISMGAEMVRIYPTLVIKDTYLEKLYFEGKYKPQTLQEAVSLAKRLMIKFEENGVNVIRVGLQSTDEICENGSVTAGPVHSSFREIAENAIYRDIIEDDLKDAKCTRADVFVNPTEISKAVGNKRFNIMEIKKKMNIDIKIYPDKNLKKREVRCVCF